MTNAPALAAGHLKNGVTKMVWFWFAIWFGLAIVAGVAASGIGAHAQTAPSRSYYDSNGHFAGSSSTSGTNGNTTTFTDRNGHFNGSAIRNSDGSRSFYDGRGHFSGSSPRR
jgi:hypothetical protein